MYCLFTVKPEFDEELSPTQVQIMEGESRVLNFTAMANPADITYTLLKKGEASSALTLEKGEITISEVKRKKSGDYGIKAVNTEGTTIFNFTLDVQCRFIYSCVLTLATPKITSQKFL